jgi:hypothetical protein
MTTLSVSLGGLPASDGSLKAQSLKDCKPETLTEQSLHSLDITLLASDLSDTSVWVPMDLAAFIPALANNAIVSICVHETNSATNINFQPIHTAFLLAGLKQTTESKRADGSITWTATKVPTKTTNNAVRLNSIFTLDKNDDEIDEDDLLQSNDARALLAPPPAMSSVKTKGGVDDDCGGRAPCENCSCGRAAGAMKNGEEKKQDGYDGGSSNCGKCSLGDAFRCASCPHLGKPAWKPGEEKIVLSLDLQDDF